MSLTGLNPARELETIRRAPSFLRIRFRDRPMKSLVWPLLVLLIVLHHDFWFWNDSTLVFGWCPVGLVYHMALTVVAAAFWAFAVKAGWPERVVADAKKTSPQAGGPAA